MLPSLITDSFLGYFELSRSHESSVINTKLSVFIKKFCSGINEQEVARFLNLNNILLRKFKENTHHTIPENEKQDYFVAFVWGLTAEAVEKGEGFTQGTYKFEDEPDYRITEFFRSIAYRRFSSHFKGRVKIKGCFAWLFSAYAIDDNRLPAGHRTAIFAPVDTLSTEKKYSFLKTEDHSAHFLKPLDCLHHAWGYVKTRPRANNWEARNWKIFKEPLQHSFREEDMPGELREELMEILKSAPKSERRFRCLRVHPKEYSTMVKNVLAYVHKYGIAGVWKTSKEILAFADKQAKKAGASINRAAWVRWAQRVRHLRERLQILYPEDVEVRKGKEVVLSSLLKK